jgi:hypothetical protein
MGKNATSLLSDFDKVGIPYELLRPKPGEIMNAGELADFAKYANEHAGWAFAIAGVLVAWTKALRSRKIAVTLKDGTIIQTEGLGVGELAKVLPHAKTLVAMESSGTPLREIREPSKGSSM